MLLQELIEIRLEFCNSLLRLLDSRLVLRALPLDLLVLGADIRVAIGQSSVARVERSLRLDLVVLVLLVDYRNIEDARTKSKQGTRTPEEASKTSEDSKQNINKHTHVRQTSPAPSDISHPSP